MRPVRERSATSRGQRLRTKTATPTASAPPPENPQPLAPPTDASNSWRAAGAKGRAKGGQQAEDLAAVALRTREGPTQKKTTAQAASAPPPENPQPRSPPTVASTTVRVAGAKGRAKEGQRAEDLTAVALHTREGPAKKVARTWSTIAWTSHVAAHQITAGALLEVRYRTRVGTATALGRVLVPPMDEDRGTYVQVAFLGSSDKVANDRLARTDVTLHLCSTPSRCQAKPSQGVELHATESRLRSADGINEQFYKIEAQAREESPLGLRCLSGPEQASL